MEDLKFHIVRHVPVINPNRIWYGDEIEIDLLSDAVRARFNELAAILPSPDAAQIYSSPYIRAQLTAAGFIDAAQPAVKPDITIEPGFQEQQYGLMTNQPHELIKDLPHVVAYMSDMWSTAPEKGESLGMFYKRISGAFGKTIKETGNETRDIIIFCHGGVQMASASMVTGIRMDELMKERRTRKDLDFSYMSVLTIAYQRESRKWSKSLTTNPGIHL